MGQIKVFLSKWFITGAVAALAVLAPIKPVLLTAFALVLGDMVLGIAVSLKNKVPVTASGIRVTIVKLIAYEVCIVAGFIVEQNLTGTAIPFVKILGSMIGLAEFKSIVENASVLSGVQLTKAIAQQLSGAVKTLAGVDTGAGTGTGAPPA